MNVSTIRNHPGCGHLTWVFPGKLADSLDSATWLRTTQQLRTLGWQVSLITVGPVEQKTINQVEVTSIPATDRFLLRSLGFHVRLLRYLLAHWSTIDVVLFHQMTAIWMLALLPIRLFRGGKGPRFVMDTRDLNAVDGTLKNRIRKLYYDLAHALANRWADGQTAITPRMAELVHIPARQRLGYWPSGVDIERFAAVAQARSWPEPGRPIELVYVGILLSERNLLPLCAAVRQANQLGMSFRLTFVGSGPLAAQLQSVAEASNGQIRVLPPIPHDRVPVMLQGTHVGVTSLPEPENEKFQASSPIKLFEYMAAGLPVLATSIVCHTDVVQAGRYAFWADSASEEGLLAALQMLWQARDCLAAYGAEARCAVEAYSWQAATQKLSIALSRALN